MNVLAETYVPDGETMGVETFMRTLVVPLLSARFPRFRPENIVFVLDPACFQRSQADEKTIAQVVTKHGYQVLRASTNDPEKRVDAVEQLLTRQIDGTAGFLIDPSCTHIINTLEWGHRYKRLASGVGTTVVEKNHFSHQGDSVQYFALHHNAQVSGGYYGRAQARTVTRANYCYA